MNINKNCKLFLTDLYYYDIESCHYNILKRLNYDISDLTLKNKDERNIQIGLLMKKNPNIIPIIRSLTESMINEFLSENKINDDDIICRQYDGFLSKKPLFFSYNKINIILKDKINILIICYERQSYIGIDNKNEIIVKGINDKYEKINKYYKKILNINFYDKKSIFKSLHNIKNELLYEENNPNIFSIPIENDYYIQLKKYGKMKIRKNLINILDLDDIDRMWYFEYYLKKFFNSIVITFV